MYTMTQGMDYLSADNNKCTNKILQSFCANMKYNGRIKSPEVFNTQSEAVFTADRPADRDPV